MYGIGQIGLKTLMLYISEKFVFFIELASLLVKKSILKIRIQCYNSIYGCGLGLIKKSVVEP